MLLVGFDDQVSSWLSAQLGIPKFAPPYTTIGVTRSGSIVAAAIFNNYRHPNIEITFASSCPKWATKETIRGILSYPFVQLSCKRITAITDASNQPARAFLSRLGFDEEGYHPDVFSDGDAVTYGLLRKNCHWLGDPIGKIRTDTAASA